MKTAMKPGLSLGMATTMSVAALLTDAVEGCA